MSSSKGSYKTVSLLDVISCIFEDGGYFGDLPVGVEAVEVMTPESIRIMFIDRVDYNLFCRLAIEDGYTIDSGSYSPRIVYRGNIVARVGSKSDPGADRNIFVYIFPSSIGAMSTYMRAAAIRYGILNPTTNRINMEKLLKYNLKVIGLVEKYRKSRYQNLISKLNL